MSNLYLSTEYSDITFVVEKERIPAHRNIVASSSPYFRAMLQGQLAESTQTEIELNVSLVAFMPLLKYMYTGLMSLAHIREEHLLEVLTLAKQCGFEALIVGIVKHLGGRISLESCWKFLEESQLNNWDLLTDRCMEFIDRNADTMLASKLQTFVAERVVQYFATRYVFCCRNGYIDCCSCLVSFQCDCR